MIRTRRPAAVRRCGLPAPRGRLAARIGISLLLALPGLAVAQSVTTQTATTQAAAAPPPARKLYVLVSLLAVSAIAVVAFVVGSYLMIRAGRALMRRQPRKTPTSYVDAWAGYRVTEEQIDAATRESDLPPDPPPSDNPQRGDEPPK